MVEVRLREVRFLAQVQDSDSDFGLLGYKAFARSTKCLSPLGLLNEVCPWRTGQVGSRQLHE